MLSSALFLFIWSLAAVLSAPPPLPASGPGVPSPDAGDPGIALLVLVTGLLVLVGCVLITVGIRSARANERAVDAPEPPSPDAELADSHAGRPACEEQETG